MLFDIRKNKYLKAIEANVYAKTLWWYDLYKADPSIDYGNEMANIMMADVVKMKDAVLQRKSIRDLLSWNRAIRYLVKHRDEFINSLVSRFQFEEPS